MQALYALAASVKTGSVPSRTLDLVHLRASQINGCSTCVDMHASDFKQAGETDERLFAVAAGGRRLTLKVSFLAWMLTSRRSTPVLVHRLCSRGEADLLLRAAGFRSSLL
jgi:AhpD family alkylhydroperoxidase